MGIEYGPQGDFYDENTRESADAHAAVPFSQGEERVDYHPGVESGTTEPYAAYGGPVSPLDETAPGGGSALENALSRVPEEVNQLLARLHESGSFELPEGYTDVTEEPKQGPQEREVFFISDDPVGGLMKSVGEEADYFDDEDGDEHFDGPNVTTTTTISVSFGSAGGKTILGQGMSYVDSQGRIVSDDELPPGAIRLGKDDVVEITFGGGKTQSRILRPTEPADEPNQRLHEQRPDEPEA